MDTLLPFETVSFGLALWLGLYLIGRDPANVRLRLAGLGLLSYALWLALDALSSYAPSARSELWLDRLRWPLPVVIAVCWTGTLILLVPEDLPLRARLQRVWRYGYLPIGVLLYLIVAMTGVGLDVEVDRPHVGGYILFLFAFLLPMLLTLGLVLRTSWAEERRGMSGPALTATLFFALGGALLLLPLDTLPRGWIALSIGADLVVLGMAIAALDAFDQGESLLPDFVRSFDASLIFVLLFAGQVALLMVLVTGVTFATLALLLGTTAAAIATQVFSGRIGAWMDRVAFARFPRLSRARSELRAVSDVLPRMDHSLDPDRLNDAEFTRLTRHALTHFGNLPRLAASPLTRLELVDTRLTERGVPDAPLERAAELKAILAESITRLKPRGQGEFGATAEWRYYNALYFPYVIGLKPYNRRTQAPITDPVAREALAWFREQVPERTLYNWQTAATKLVAEDLRAKQPARRQ